MLGVFYYHPLDLYQKTKAACLGTKKGESPFFA